MAAPASETLRLPDGVDARITAGAPQQVVEEIWFSLRSYGEQKYLWQELHLANGDWLRVTMCPYGNWEQEHRPAKLQLLSGNQAEPPRPDSDTNVQVWRRVYPVPKGRDGSRPTVADLVHCILTTGLHRYRYSVLGDGRRGRHVDGDKYWQ